MESMTRSMKLDVSCLGECTVSTNFVKKKVPVYQFVHNGIGMVELEAEDVYVPVGCEEVRCVQTTNTTREVMGNARDSETMNEK